MTTDNWINLIAAILIGGGTLALALMTWRSIRQTRAVQKRERKERLLNEIIEWAIDICRCGLKPVPIPTSEMARSKTGVKLYATSILAELLLEYESISGRTEYINRITSSFRGNLQSIVHGLAKVVGVRTKLIEQQIDILSDKRVDVSGMTELTKTSVFKEWTSLQDWPKGLSKSFKVNMFKMLMNRTVLLDNAKQVIEEAVKIKAGDIS